MKYLNLNINFLTEVCNFVLWNDFSLKFCSLKWIQSEIVYSETISVGNFVLWHEFSLKFCVLKWFRSKIQTEILCSEMNSVGNSDWNFALWNEFRLKICALKWIQIEILCSETNSVWNFALRNFVFWTGIFCPSRPSQICNFVVLIEKLRITF